MRYHFDTEVIVYVTKFQNIINDAPLNARPMGNGYIQYNPPTQPHSIMITSDNANIYNFHFMLQNKMDPGMHLIPRKHKSRIELEEIFHAVIEIRPRPR